MTATQVDGTIPSQIYNYFSGQIRLLDEYYLIKTGENSYVGNIVKPTGKEYTYEFTRSTSYSSYYSVTVTEEESTININNPLYAYSSVGTLGNRLESVNIGNMACFSLCFIACLVALWVCFRGVIFKCFGIRKK